MNLKFWKSCYEASRGRKPSPVWSTIWGQINLDTRERYRSTIKWQPYVSPSEYADHIRPPERPEANALLEQARLRQEADARRKAAWLESNTLDATPYIEKWDVTAGEVRDGLLDIATKTFPMMDGLEQVNETIKYAFEMKDAEIDSREFAAVVESLFRMQVFEFAVKRAFPDQTELQAAIMMRVAARELPTKDNTVEKRSSNASVEAAIREMSAHQSQHRREPRPPFDPLGQRSRKAREKDRDRVLEHLDAHR